MSKLSRMIIKYSTPKVSPANWQNPRCSTKNDWYIQYRIYLDTGTKQVILKGMNKFKTWDERYKCTAELLDAEILKLQKQQETPELQTLTLSKQEYKDLVTAMMDMCDNKTCVQRHRDNLKTKVDRFCSLAKTIYGQTIKVEHLGTQMIYTVLDKMYKEYKTFTDKTYNCYIKDLGAIAEMLYKREYIKENYFKKIDKKPVVKELRVLLTPAQRRKIDQFLHQHHYCLWRFMHIFFHSGARETELCRMETKDIHLKERFFVVTIIKGKSRRREIKAMLPESYRHWAEVVAENKKYPFGPNLEPSDEKQMDPLKIANLWRRSVKKQLGISSDFYSLKHLHTDIIDAMEGTQLAAEHDGHLDESTTETYYALGKRKRKLDKLKQLNIKF